VSVPGDTDTGLAVEGAPMMATTHLLAGMLLGLALAPLAPGMTTAAVVAGALGGVAPDLDALGAHRRDLHFPVYASVGTVGTLVPALVTGWPALVLLTAFLGGAGLHALTDALGGGRSLRPWAESVDRAVYCHAQGRWWRPRGWIPYDGSRADFAVAVGLAIPAFAFLETSALRWLVGGLLVASLGYVLVRRRVPAVVDAVAGRRGVTGVSDSRRDRPRR
jgi:hypothetical protein